MTQQEKSDRRSRRSRPLIVGALPALMRERRYDRITLRNTMRGDRMELMVGRGAANRANVGVGPSVVDTAGTLDRRALGLRCAVRRSRKCPLGDGGTGTW